MLVAVQVYRADTGKYICHNKYYGRRLDVGGVRDTLRHFLFDGYKHRLELVAPIVERLRKLLAMLSKQSTFRFYSSSLLIMYDGADGRRGTDGERGAKNPPVSVSPAPATAASGNLLGRPSSHASFVSRSGGLHEPLTMTATSTAHHLHVDVRMIDFAHATHHGFLHDKTAHVGPDHGYLFGLKNLIQLFETELYSSDDTSHDSTAESADDCSSATATGFVAL